MGTIQWSWERVVVIKDNEGGNGQTNKYKYKI